MIGIGVTTYKREEVFEKTIAAIAEFTQSEYTLYVARDTDEDRRGVAKRKNECLENLKHCDYIFLFDDDCHPKKMGWEQFVIDASAKTNCQHFIYNKPPFCNIDNYKFINGYTLECFDASGGVMMFYTKAVIEKIGGFYTGYELYGFEHIGHSMRIKRAQFTPDWFVSIEGLCDYIHSYDYDVPQFFLENSCIEETHKWELSKKNKEICYAQDLEIYRPIIFWTMGDKPIILYKFATRSRPERFQQALDSIINNADGTNFRILVTIDDDDEQMQKASKEPQHSSVTFISGVSNSKIHAINRDMELAMDWDWQILVNFSDDMLITSKNFEPTVREAFYVSGAWDYDIFLHLPDGYANERLCTLSIMGREYYKRFNYIYHPSYVSVYCDNEATEVAKRLGRYIYKSVSVYTHLHPSNVNAHWDAQYEKNESPNFYSADNFTFHDRWKKNFPI